MQQITVPSGQSRNLWKILTYGLPIAGIATGLFLLVLGMAQPWNGLGDSDGALFSSIAHNYQQFGVLQLKLGQLTTFEEISRPTGIYYLHHPPLFPLLEMISFSLFGETEMSARLVSVLATLATAGLLFCIVKKASHFQAGIWAVFFFMTYPSTVFFGRKPGYEALTLLLVVLATWLYLKYRERPDRGTLFLLFCMVAAGAASDWAAYFLPAALVAHYLVTRKDRRIDWPLVSGLFFLPAAVLAVFLISAYSIDKTSLTNLLEQGRAYAGLFLAGSKVAKTIVEAQITFSLKEYFFRLILNFSTAFGSISALLALLGIAFIRSNKEMRGAVTVLASVGLFTFVIFWRSLYFHLWWLHLLTVPLAILGAMAVHGMLGLAEHDAQAYRQATKTGITVAVVLPVLLVMLFNVWQLRNVQARILPEDRLEKPDFIRQLGGRLRASTDIGDQILTNLAPPNRHLPDPYQQILPYYARRVIHSSIESPDQIIPLIRQGRNHSSRATYFLLWSDEGGDHTDRPLVRWLQDHGRMTNLSIEGHEFRLYKLLTTPGTGDGDSRAASPAFPWH